MSARLVLFCAVAGCGFEAPLGGPGTDGGGDPMPADACVSFSAQLDTCVIGDGTEVTLSGDLELSTDNGTVIDKMTGMPVPVSTRTFDTLEAPVVAIVGSYVKLMPNTKLRAVGQRGFAILASRSIELGANALIDVSDGGANARVSCDDGPSKGEDDNGGGGGGGGAGFGGAGGKGGQGNSDNIIRQSAGGDAGQSVATPPRGPRGGCPGAPGGRGNEAGGAPGRGGGAVWLAAGDRIAIVETAGVNAGGGGGGGAIRTGSQGDGGGGGGGSGGVIWIEAPRVQIAGTLAANGGGGGEGAGGDKGGHPGGVGVLGTARALGGAGGAETGADGAGGGHLDDGKGVNGPSPEPGGGGGGGGGVGFIRVIAGDRQLGVTSPQP